MEFSAVVVFILALLLAVFEPGLSQQDGDDEVQVRLILVALPIDLLMMR